MNRIDQIIEPRYTKVHGENVVVERMAKLSMKDIAWEAWKKNLIDLAYSKGEAFDEQEALEEFNEWITENL